IAALVPVHLQCLRIPATWRYRREACGAVRFYCSVEKRLLSDPEGETEPVQLDEFDPWLWRLRFLDVNAGDRDCLLQFLNQIGCYATLGPATGKSPVIAIRARDGRHVYGYEPRPLEH